MAKIPCGGFEIGTGLSLDGKTLKATGYTLPAATKTALGGVKMATKVAEAAGSAPTAAEFKALIDALVAAGIMAAE